MCSATGLMNKTGILPYSMKQLFRRNFRFLGTSSYVAVGNLNQLVLFFSESMYCIMTSSLAGLFLNSRSAISLKNLFSGVGSPFNVLFSLLMVFFISFLTSLKSLSIVGFLWASCCQWSLFRCRWLILVSFIQGVGGLVNFFRTDSACLHGIFKIHLLALLIFDEVAL